MTASVARSPMWTMSANRIFVPTNANTRAIVLSRSGLPVTFA